MQNTPENAYEAGYKWFTESRAINDNSMIIPSSIENFKGYEREWQTGLNNAQNESGLHNPKGGNRVRKSSSRRKPRKTRKTKRRKSYRR